jgi:UDP-N-acetylglucosamine transferase subunit ALG13
VGRNEKDLPKSAVCRRDILIFVTVGSQKIQFDRLLKKIDELIEEGKLKEEVFAQVGYSTYIPKHFSYEKFLNKDQFCEHIEKCSFVITHAGTGAIITSLKKGKKVIAVPRLAKYQEHVDDHQLEIIEVLNEKKYLFGIKDTDQLYDAIQNIDSAVFNRFVSTTDKVLEAVDNFIKDSGRR